MEKIKNIEELRKQQELEKFSDDEISERLAFSIECRNKSGENKLTFYKYEHPSTARDYIYEYIKKHKRELREKGYKVSFSYIDALMGYPEYIIRW